MDPVRSLALCCLLAVSFAACDRERDPRGKRLGEAVARVAAQDAAPAAARTRTASARGQMRADTAATNRWERAYADAIAAHLRTLEQRGDADAAIDYALLLPLARSLESDIDVLRMRALRDAALARPDDPFIATLRAAYCRTDSDPNCASFAEEWADLDPDNGAALLLAAHRNGDGDGVLAPGWLLSASEAVRHDTGHEALGRRVLQALEAVPVPPMDPTVSRTFASRVGSGGQPLTEADAPVMMAWAIVAAYALPAYGPVQTACAPRDSMAAAKAAQCLALARQMSGSDTVIARFVGLRMGVRLTADSIDGRTWRERFRQHLWVYARAPTLMNSWSMGRVSLERGEWAAMLVALQRSGVPRTPPPGWLPDNPRHRALILTGREPPGR